MTLVGGDRVGAAVLDGHLLSDAALRRLGPMVGGLTRFRTGVEDRGFAERWAQVAPEVPLLDGGRVYDVRHAVIECARRQILVLATGEPRQPARFLAGAAQGAARATELGVPGIALHVMRQQDVPGEVVWLTQSGRMSGYGVLFAVGFAQAHGRSATLVEPTTGISELKTPEALERAFDLAASAGVEFGIRSEDDPLAHVLRGTYSIAITPVLDVPGGRALLRPGELPLSSVSSGNPGAVVRLLSEFPGDVVAVLDGIELLGGHQESARIASAVMLAVVAAGGVELMSPSRAVAVTSPSTTISAPPRGDVPGLVVEASGLTQAPDATTSDQTVAIPDVATSHARRTPATFTHDELSTLLGAQEQAAQPGADRAAGSDGATGHEAAILAAMAAAMVTAGGTLRTGDPGRRRRRRADR
ncbi:hypothetical protein CSO01_36450 [Cellulomonas soli]|uniref:Uncharacterized protein n=1 Tax=Cellulomonas soli TaxID=931535 RepID=A0A512PI99_9CELL|nr:hypothetical protein CSO01_36450 [Cellulomonas soli]